MAKTAETFLKVASTFTKRAAKEYAKAKNDEGGFHYETAKRLYKTAAKATENAIELSKKK